MAKTRRLSSDAVEVLHRRFYEGRPSRLKGLEEARANEEIARKIRELRKAAVHRSAARRPCNLSS
jgi:predicted Holliday junction resolvase-like endonuclease